MYVIKVIFDACYSILSYQINLFGYNISLLNVFVFSILVSLCIYILKSLS